MTDLIQIKNTGPGAGARATAGHDRGMKTAKTVIISRGPWTDQGGREALGLLFVVVEVYIER